MARDHNIKANLSNDEIKRQLGNRKDIIFADDWLAGQLGDKEQITEEDMKICREVAGAFNSHPIIAPLVESGIPELSIYHSDGPTGQLVKVRPDLYSPEHGVIVDLKTCNDARPESVARDIYRYQYHLSAAMYLSTAREAGLYVDKFLWAFVEKKAPWSIMIYKASPAMLDLGYAKYRELLSIYSECANSDVWPGYQGSDSVQMIEFDEWVYRKEGVMS